MRRYIPVIVTFLFYIFSTVFSTPLSAAIINSITFERETGLKILSPASGKIQLEQVNLVFDAGRVIDSDWGRIKVKFPNLGSDCSGYVNFFIDIQGKR